jgi:hypothetical protein
VAIARRANSAGHGGPIVGRRRRWFRKHFDVIDQRHRRFKEQLAERAGPPQSIGGIEWREAFSVRVANRSALLTDRLNANGRSANRNRLG